MAKCAVVFVPYRPIWYYEMLGPCVRDWAAMEAAFVLCDQAGIPTWIIDRPMFPPWRSAPSGRRPLRQISDRVPEDRIVRQSRVSLPAAFLYSRRASAPIIERTLQNIRARYDRILILDFDPFGEISAPFGAVHWFDEIDDFSKHHRIPRRDRQAFLKKRQHSHNIHTASNLKSKEGTPVPNWVFTPITPAPRTDTWLYEFGYLGYVDNKIDVDLVKRIAARGKIGIWGKILDRNVRRQLSEIPGVDLMGEYDGGQLQHIMSLFRFGIIPFLVDRIHGNSPIKYYQYSAAHKPCLSTSDFGLVRENLVVFGASRSDAVLDAAIDSLTACQTVDWAAIEQQNNEGRQIFETRFAAALSELT